MANVTKEINGVKYNIIPFTGRVVLDLNFKVQNVVTKAFGIANNMNKKVKDEKERTSNFIVAFQQTIGEMESEERFELLAESLKQTTASESDDKPDVELNSVEAISEFFATRFDDVYAVLTEVWAANHIRPFA